MAYLLFYLVFTAGAAILIFRLVYQLVYEPIVLFFKSYFAR